MNTFRLRSYHEIRVYLFWALIIACVIYLLKVTFNKGPTEVVIVREEVRKEPETFAHKESHKKATDDNQVGDVYNNDDLRRQILPPDTEFDQIKQHLENVKKEIEHFSKDHKESKHKPKGMEAADKQPKDALKPIDQPAINNSAEKLNAAIGDLFNFSQWKVFDESGIEKLKVNMLKIVNEISIPEETLIETNK